MSTLKSTLKKPVYPIKDKVSKAFLRAMVSLIGSYRDALRLKPVRIPQFNVLTLRLRDRLLADFIA